MLLELNKRLLETKEKLRTKQKLVKKVGELRQELINERSRFGMLKTALHKEGRDVEKLEGLSLKAIFHTILGSKEEQLEKERQEYLAAKLKFDECRNSLSMLQANMDSLEDDLSKLGGTEAHYESVFKEKEKYLLACGDSSAQKILQIAEQIADINSDTKELMEAVSIGKEVLIGMNHVIDSLQSAKGWGTWDLLGGGLISTAIKHSRIDDAREAVHRVQHQLRVFQKELNDVDPNSNPVIIVDIGSLATFADYFFDGLITDWIVQSRINDSLENAANVRDKVEVIVNSLQDTLSKKKTELKLLDEKRQKLVESI